MGDRRRQMCLLSWPLLSCLWELLFASVCLYLGGARPDVLVMALLYVPQLLFQETNPGVRYEYTISRDPVADSNGTHPVSDFSWQFGSWTECSATCGAG